MTDPIEEAEAFLVEAAGRWPLSDDCACGLCRACAHVHALIAAARADREAVKGKRVVAVRDFDAMRTALAEADAKLAAVTAERDELVREFSFMHGHMTLAVEGRDAAESKLAAVTAERDDANARCRRMIDAKNRWLRRAKAAESALARAMEAISRMSDAYRADQQQNGGDHG